VFFQVVGGRELLVYLKMCGDAYAYQEHRRAVWAAFTVGFLNFVVLWKVYCIFKGFCF